MHIKDVERFTIPVPHNFSDIPGVDATTVGDLADALSLLPEEAVITVDPNYGGIFATHYKPDIEV